MWSPPPVVSGLAPPFLSTAVATPCDAGRAQEQAPSAQQPFAHSPFVTNAVPNTSSAFASAPLHQPPINAMAAAQGSLLQSLLMQGVGGMGAGPQGPQGPPGVGQVGNGHPARTLEQQAFLLQLLAAQQQVLAVQAGQLDAVTGMAAMAQGAALAQHHQASRSADEQLSLAGASPHFSQAAGDASRALHRQASASALHKALTGGDGPDGAPQGRLELVFPRRGRKSGEGDKKVQDPVLITHDVMQRLFHLPLTEAARQLGLSPTAIKGACRRLGIKKWPYRMVTAKSHRRAPRKPSPTAKEPATSGLSLLSAAAEVELHASSTEQSTPAASPPAAE